MDNNLDRDRRIDVDHSQKQIVLVFNPALQATEKLAAARGNAKLVTDASGTAEPLFEKRGFVAERRNTMEIEGEYLGNTRMTKALAPKAAPDVRP